MKLPVFVLIAGLVTGSLRAGVEIDIPAFGTSLGGWKDASARTVDYELSGSKYRTYEPEITPTPDGGIFVSVRIDHLRGWLANNDHAVLEISFAADGELTSAQSTLAIQGRTISSDLIRASADAGGRLTGVNQAVKVGTDLVADVSSKLLREKIVEAGRVSFPAAIRHNYNLLYQALVIHPVALPVNTDGTAVEPSTDDSEEGSEATPTKLEIKPFGVPKK